MRLFAGIEGGGTRTTCVIGDETGKLLGTGCGGPSNYLTVGIEKTKRSLREAFHGALSKESLEQPLEAVCAGLAGVGLSPQPPEIEAAVREVTKSGRVIIKSDGCVALYGAFAGTSGMIVVSGTGSVAMGAGKNREFARVGGWGHILGDEGSGFHIALEGMRAVVRSHDGLLPLTELTKRALCFLGLERVEELVKVFYLESLGKDRLAAFSKEVVEAAAGGDRVAIEIISSECRALKLMVKVLRAKLSLDSPRLALSGGLFEQSEWFRKRFTEELGNEAEVVKPLFCPATGAFMLALTSSAIELTAGVMENIRSSEVTLHTDERSTLLER